MIRGYEVGWWRFGVVLLVFFMIRTSASSWEANVPSIQPGTLNMSSYLILPATLV
jgi:hypothetical protein